MFSDKRPQACGKCAFGLRGACPGSGSMFFNRKPEDPGALAHESGPDIG